MTKEDLVKGIEMIIKDMHPCCCECVGSSTAKECAQKIAERLRVDEEKLLEFLDDRYAFAEHKFLVAHIVKQNPIKLATKNPIEVGEEER